MFLKAAVEIQTDAQRKLLADLIEQHADLSSIIMEDVREIGCEWLCKQALEELSVCEFLKQCNWDETQAERALMHIISRATCPHQSIKLHNGFTTTQPLQNCLTKIRCPSTDFHLYRASSMLYKQKENIEDFLSVKTDELFDLEDKTVLNDLTNTYFINNVWIFLIC